MSFISLINRTKTTLKNDGLISLAVKVITFVLHFIFQYEKYYIYKHIHQDLNEADFVPDVENISVYFVSSNHEADELAVKLPDFRGYSVYSAQRLDRGAVACCLYIGREFAHFGWIALDRRAQETISPYPFPVNFADKEACTGGGYTMRKYESKGLLTYGYYKRLTYLGNRGIKVVWNIVDKNNRAAQKVEAKFNPVLFAEARYMRIFCLKFWKQTLF